MQDTSSTRHADVDIPRVFGFIGDNVFVAGLLSAQFFLQLLLQARRGLPTILIYGVIKNSLQSTFGQSLAILLNVSMCKG